MINAQLNFAHFVGVRAPIWVKLHQHVWSSIIIIGISHMDFVINIWCTIWCDVYRAWYPSAESCRGGPLYGVHTNSEFSTYPIRCVWWTNSDIMVWREFFISKMNFDLITIHELAVHTIDEHHKKSAIHSMPYEHTHTVHLKLLIYYNHRMRLHFLQRATESESEKYKMYNRWNWKVESCIWFSTH